jgi:hypothetical protein
MRMLVKNQPSFETSAPDGARAASERFARRRDHHNDHAQGAAWFAARGNSDLAEHELADTMSTANSGSGWHHWWLAFVSQAQRNGTPRMR